MRLRFQEIIGDSGSVDRRGRACLPLFFGLWVMLGSVFCAEAAEADSQRTSSTARAGTSLGAKAMPAAGKEGTASTVVAVERTSYQIRSGDTVEVRVYQEEDLNARARVDEEGTVVLPLIGRVAIRGKTTEAARLLISDRYGADYLQHPQVTVLVSEFAPRRFVMMGQVSRPGVYEIPSSERLNLLQAIAMAGGYTKIADPSKVRIRRTSEKGEEILRVNAKALATGGGGGSEIPLIFSDDNITVGESAF